MFLKATPSASGRSESHSDVNNPSFWLSCDSNQWLPTVSRLQQAAVVEGRAPETLTPAFNLPLPDYNNPVVEKALKHAFRENVSSAFGAMGADEDLLSKCQMYMNDFMDEKRRGAHLPEVMRSLLR